MRAKRAMTVAKKKRPEQDLEKGSTHTANFGGDGPKRADGAQRFSQMLGEDSDEEQKQAEADALSFGGLAAQNPNIMKTIDPDALVEGMGGDGEGRPRKQTVTKTVKW